MKTGVLKPLRAAIYALVFLAGLVLFTVLLLTGTEGGTSFLVRTALDRVEAGTTLRFEVGEIEGTLFSEVAFRQVNLRDTANGFRLNAEFLGGTLNTLALLDGSVHFARLDARGLALTLPTEDNDEPADPQEILRTLFSLPVSISADSVEVTGFTLTGTAPFTLQSLTGAVQWSNTRMHVTALATQQAGTWAAPDVELVADGYRLAGTLGWQAPLGDGSAAGNARISGTLYSVDVSHQLTAPVAVTSTGNIDTGLRAGDVFGFDITHRTDNVGGGPFGVPALENVAGTVTTTGTPARISIGTDTEVRITGLGNTTVRGIAVYENSGLAIDTLALVNERFTFDADGMIDFADGTTLSLDWRLADFSDGDLWPQLDLSGVNGNGAVNLAMADGDTVTQLTLASLTGNLNGYPLSGAGDVTLSGGSVNNVALTLASDVNSLLLEGSITPQLDLLWELQAPALTQLLDGLTGEIIGSGTLTGSLELPQVAGSLDAAGLSWRSGDTAFDVGALNAQASYSGTSNAVVLTWTGVSGQVAGRDVVQESGVLELTGSPADHAFSLSTRGPDLGLTLDGEGTYTTPTWQGALAGMTLNSPFGDWQLQDSLALTLAPEQASIGNHCWFLRDIMACGEADWTRAGGLGGNLAIDNIPLAWFNDNLDATIPGTQAIHAALAQRPQGIVDYMHAYQVAMPGNGLIDGMLDLTLAFDGVGLAFSNTTLSADLAPRDVSIGILRQQPDDPDTNAVQVERYGIDDIALTVQRDAGRWQMQNSFEIYLGEAGGLDFQGDFTSTIALSDDDSLVGDFSLVFNDIAWVEALAPNLSQVRGELGASGNISGTLRQPLLNMDARLDAGSFRLPEFGLFLHEVSLEMHSVNSNEITITGNARSGEGSISLDSLLTMPLLDSRTLEISVRGDRFQLLDTPETRMAVAPDLTLDYRDGVLDVRGSLDVPVMHIDFTDRAATSGDDTVDVSRDVVIVAEDGSQSAAESAELLGLIPVSGEVRLGMGDDVTFQGYGLDLRLTGDLQLEQSVDRPMLAHGELSIPTGSYELYAQRLTIENGKLLFLGNPLNPALDIRAVRQTREAEVGLLMNGTVRRINAQLFSTPTLPESEVLSLLITGNSFGSGGDSQGENMLGAIALLGLEKGQGLTSTVTGKLGIDSVAIRNDSDDYRDSAIGLGKYIRPNLFMRYDIGLFDRENALTLDYILTERLRLEVESGVSQSVDLTYTVEK